MAEWLTSLQPFGFVAEDLGWHLWYNLWQNRGVSFIYPQEAETVYRFYAFDKIRGLESERSCSDLFALLLIQMMVYGQRCFSRCECS